MHASEQRRRRRADLRRRQLQLVEGFRIAPSFDQSGLTGFNTNTFYLSWSAADLLLAPSSSSILWPRGVNGRKAVAVRAHHRAS